MTSRKRFRRGDRAHQGLAIGLVLAACVGCGGESPSVPPAPAAATSPAVAVPSAVGSQPKIVVLGDSLTAGLGIQQEEAYPAVLQRRLDEAGYHVEVVNAGVSGDTSAGGLRRLDWSLAGDVRVLVLALGANDGLRGLPVEGMRKNLEAIIEQASSRGIAVLLVGMEAPPNYGEEYARSFRNVFRELADRHHLKFVPFLLRNVAGVPELNQSDGIHPTRAGAEKIADGLWPALQDLIVAEQMR